MGCRSSTGRGSPLRLLPRDVLPFLASPTLGNAAPRSYLLGQHFLEHQRYFAQFHSQSLFSLALLNRLFSILESITVGFSQIFYECIHMQHHKGNADLPNENGETVDWISIYKHSHDGAAEHPFGHSLSYLNGFYRHYGGNPDEPLAWGVSSYDKLYNWTWFYNGYHAEHHFRPKVHWTRIQALRDQILEEQRAAGVRVIKLPHALGFLDPDLPPHSRSESMEGEPQPTKS